jgi:serine protease AprX
MRYAVIAKSVTPERLDRELKKVGARDINKTRLLGQVFCELDEGQAEALAAIPGLMLKPI